MKDNILYVLKVLQEYSDKEHPITQQEIIKKIYMLYTESIDRRTIKGYIDTLNDFGYNIVSLKKGEGYYYDNRLFTKNEATYIMDAIYSSKSLDSNQARNLVSKIKNTFSENERKDYNYVFKNSSLTTKFDDTIFSKIDKITCAIKESKKIEYHYKDYDKYGIERIEEKARITSPYYFINKNNHYYILCVDKDKTIELRIDRMTDIAILDDSRDDISKTKNYKPGFNIQEYINEHIYMFGNEIVNAKIMIKSEKYVKDVIDWFGNTVKILPKDNKIYANFRCEEYSLIYWALQYGDAITIVSPLNTRLKVARLIEQLKKDYINNDLDITKFKFREVADDFLPKIFLMDDYSNFTYLDFKNKLIEHIEEYYFNLVKCNINDDGLIELKKDDQILYKVNFRFLEGDPSKEIYYSLLKDIMIHENDNTYNYVLTKNGSFYFNTGLFDENTKYFDKKGNYGNLPLKFKMNLENGEYLFYEKIHEIKWTVKKPKEFYGYYVI